MEVSPFTITKLGVAKFRPMLRAFEQGGIFIMPHLL
jgi:hypothetical protein